MTESSRTLALNPEFKAASRRSAWLKLLMQWHWISSAVSLVGMLLFAASGITLNNAEIFESSSVRVQRHSGVVPASLLAELKALPSKPDSALPSSLNQWLKSNWDMVISPKVIEWSQEEVFVDLKSPGKDSVLTVDLNTGAVEFEATDYGWVAYFNDLHKGKNAGRVWGWFITLFGVACVVFSITGLLILQVHARARWKVWPVTALGLLVPLLLMVLFVH